LNQVKIKQLEPILTTSVNEFKILDNGILLSMPLDVMRETIELSHAQEMTAKAEEIMGDCKFLMVHVRDGKISQEARKYFQNHPPIFDKVGIIVQGYLQILVMNFFLGINKPKMPLKLFSTEEAATEWFLKG
jgi:hypothetical protein